MQSNTAVSLVDIGKHRRSCSWTWINKEAQSRESTLNVKRRSNSTRERTKTQGKTWNSTPVRNKARARWKLHHLSWIISPLKNFWGGGKFVTMNIPQKFQECRFRLHYESVLWRTQIVLSSMTLLNVRSGLQGACLFHMFTNMIDHLGFGILTLETAVFDCICWFNSSRNR